MVDYAEALKRPFSDLKKLVIYMILSIIPVINFISVGYLLDVADNSLKKNKDLPEWDDFARLFVEGVKLFFITMIYSIPLIILLVLFVVWIIGEVGTEILSYNIEQVVSTLINLGFAASIFLAAIFLIGILILYFQIGAVIRYVKLRKIKEAFNFREISKKVFTTTFFVPWLIGSAIVAIITGSLSLIPYFGSAIGGAIGSIFYYTVLAEAYAKA